MTPEEAEKMLQSLFCKYTIVIPYSSILVLSDEANLRDDIERLQSYRQEGITSVVGNKDIGLHFYTLESI